MKRDQGEKQRDKGGVGQRDLWMSRMRGIEAGEMKGDEVKHKQTRR
jgi:hypothetical protein